MPRDAAGFPLQYLGANVPQAWAAGAVIQLLDALLGLDPDAANQLLRLRPALPDWLEAIAVENLTVGGSTVDLQLRRSADGGHSLDVRRRRGSLEIAED